MTPYEEWMQAPVVSLVAHRLAVLIHGREPMLEMLHDHLNRVQPGSAGSELAGRSEVELERIQRRLTLELSHALRDVAEVVAETRPELLRDLAKRLADSNGQNDEFGQWMRHARRVASPVDFLQLDV